MSYAEAEKKLEKEIHSALCKGKKYIEIIHGVGTYTLRKMVIKYLMSLDFVKILPEESSFNPGTLKIELDIPEKKVLDSYFY